MVNAGMYQGERPAEPNLHIINYLHLHSPVLYLFDGYSDGLHGLLPRQLSTAKAAQQGRGQGRDGTPRREKQGREEYEHSTSTAQPKSSSSSYPSGRYYDGSELDMLPLMQAKVFICMVWTS